MKLRQHKLILTDGTETSFPEKLSTSDTLQLVGCDCTDAAIRVMIPSSFDLWAPDQGYEIARAVSPTPNRIYADRQTQAAFDAWNAGGRAMARIFTESTADTEALRARLQVIGGAGG